MSESESKTDDESGNNPKADSEPVETLGVETVNLEDINAYQRNPKENEQAVEHLLDAIPKFGFQVPVVLDEDNEIVAGHARVEAARQLAGELDDVVLEHEDKNNEELETNLRAINDGEIWAVRADGLTEDEIREFRISENRTQELSSWDDNKLQFELREIEEAVGFPQDEIENIIAPNTTTEVSTDDIKDAEEELETHYKDLADDKADRKSRFPCPHCDSWIHVDVEELERALIREGVMDEDEV